jgi:lipopolysaccharide transport system ATP-binding protein
MGDIAIRVDDLGKRYRIGTIQKRHDTLRDALVAGIRAPLNRLRRNLNPSADTQVGKEFIWALRNVSLEVRHGEVLGIVGRNGAGKSTLLKILSRITEPTEGRAELYGRVGSLLEVGTGFHQELTGRENLYLSGAILGMRKTEIDRKFDEIVDFADIGKLIDTPVKRYSSGMYVRLAFAVAAHLEPEILLVDEVLAVGDVAFQRKCLGRMGDVARQGRTVLFVSHNMAAVQTLCSRGILLRKGRVWASGTPSETVASYLRTLEETASQDLLQRTERRGRGRVRLARIDISAGEGARLGTLVVGQPARFAFFLTEVRRGIACTFTIYDQYGQAVANLNSAVSGSQDLYEPVPSPVMLCELDELLLVPGRYRVNAAVACNGELEDHLEGAGFFDVEEGHVAGRPVATGSRYGSVCLRHRWTLPSELEGR